MCETNLLGQLYLQQIRYRILLNPCKTILDVFLIWKPLSSEPSIQDTELQVLIQIGTSGLQPVTLLNKLPVYRVVHECNMKAILASLQVLNWVLD